MSLLESQAPASVKRYLQFRKRSAELHSAIVATVDRKLMQECAQRLGVLKHGTLVFENEQEMAVWMDCCIYDHLRAGKNAVQRYFEHHPPLPGTDDEQLAAAMCKATYHLLAIEHARPGVGVEVIDVATQKAFVIMDMGLSRTAQRGYLMAARVLLVGNIWMTTGASIPLQPETALQLLADIGRMAARLERLNHRPGRESGIDFSTWLIRTCLRTQATQYVNYQDAVDSASGENHQMPDPRITSPQDLDPFAGNPYMPVSRMETPAGGGACLPAVRPPLRISNWPEDRDVTRTGRNQLCPCGSGRKFKKCCARR